jgi:hypothetical protein
VFWRFSSTWNCLPLCTRWIDDRWTLLKIWELFWPCVLYQEIPTKHPKCWDS